MDPLEDPAIVTQALDDLVDATVDHYREWAGEDPVMLVHAATAPRAASLVVPHLPASLWIPTYNHAWAASATIVSAYRASEPQPHHDLDSRERRDLDDVIDRVIATGDEHAIKFTEVAIESHRRGRHDAIAAADTAASLIGA